MVGFRVGHLSLPGGAAAPKMRGSLPPPALLRCATPRAVREGDTRGAASLLFSTAEAEIRVVPRLMRRFGGILNHNGEERPLRERCCGGRKSGPFRWATPLV